ncbi:hypothetical protein P0O24_05790 [Methanotrichaceae archaeon M04Ac]|jgi:hypothetical protein|uniref:Uncharacterized protein n=1 Tax=Candidatus Methanocrinis alkalitolerans TaxID=3033395 RepID=A0ABT5XEE5_9EURY|nr:hypothetical protein [Candidatus Methanocrinis alkalitolerans]MCR3884502.1 hypothetical protein [Methanothrix sp.]MDF0593092.1 hypothetical protein [Candidatus Methanocrinis alkalitolerans]
MSRIIILWLASLLLLSVGGAHLSSEEGIGRGDGTAGHFLYQVADVPQNADRPPILITIVRSERGFGMGSDGLILPVRLQVERARAVDPTRVRRLLGENRTLGEIKSEIEGSGEGYGYRGKIRLGEATYLIRNISIIIGDLNSTLEGEVMEPVWGAIPGRSRAGMAMVGKIRVETRPHNGSVVSVGSVVLFGGHRPRPESYAVILEPSIGGSCRMDVCLGPGTALDPPMGFWHRRGDGSGLSSPRPPARPPM